MNKDQLAEILDKHIKWLNKEEGGVRANLRRADLRCANLCHANLYGADLFHADLRYANLRYADLRYTELYYANLQEADLHEADLRYADLDYANLQETNLRYAIFRYAALHEANLHKADLRYADLYYTNLHKANLHDADLRYADLRKAELHGADLHEADLREADLSEANLCDANLGDILGVNNIPIACPNTGAFVGWKKCQADWATKKPLIVQLLIPEDAKRSSATGRKCRASKAIVLDVQDVEGNSIDGPAYSDYWGTASFEYQKGETVEPQQPFDENRWNECASGIHFFITRQEAVDYEVYGIDDPRSTLVVGYDNIWR